MSGRWIDVEEAAQEAASLTRMAIVGVDRWELAVLFEVRTDQGSPGSLLVVGDRNAQITGAEARVGRFRNPQQEDALLRALADELQRLSTRPRLGDDR